MYKHRRLIVSVIAALLALLMVGGLVVNAFAESSSTIKSRIESLKREESEIAEQKAEAKAQREENESEILDLVGQKNQIDQQIKLTQDSIETKNDIQIAKEIDYLIQHFNLKPKILITYKRESYKDGKGLRVTFDEQLKYRNKNLSFTKGKRDKIYFKDDHDIIMEIKANGVIPLWLVRKMSELKLYPQKFSKIGKIYERINHV